MAWREPPPLLLFGPVEGGESGKVHLKTSSAASAAARLSAHGAAASLAFKYGPFLIEQKRPRGTAVS